MNIKKIIQEEMDDLSWVDSVTDPWRNISKEKVGQLTNEESDLIEYVFKYDSGEWEMTDGCIPTYEILGIDFDENPDWGRGTYRGIKKELQVYFRAKCDSTNTDYTYITIFIDRDTLEWSMA